MRRSASAAGLAPSTPSTGLPQSPRLSLASASSSGAGDGARAAGPHTPVRSLSQPQLRTRLAVPHTARAAYSTSSGSSVARVSSIGGRAPAATPAQRECRAKLQALAEATGRARAKLGAGNPEVVKAEQELRRLRSGQEELRRLELLSWHEANLASASVAVGEGAEVAELEEALRRVRCSELGRAHRLVGEGAAQAAQARRRREAEAKDEQEAQRSRRLWVASTIGDVGAMADLVDAASESLGAGHPSVVSVRQQYRRQRTRLQRLGWDDLVLRHRQSLMDACATNNPDLVEVCIKSAASSGLGRGHPIVLHGKQYLLQLKKDLRRNREARRQGGCRQELARLADELERSLEAWRAEAAEASDCGGDQSTEGSTTKVETRARTESGHMRRSPFQLM